MKKEIKFIEELQTLEQVYEKIKKMLIEEREIDAFSFVREKEWKRNQDVGIMNIITKEESLKQQFYYKNPEFFPIKKYELFMLTKFACEFTSIILAIVYYE